MMRLSNRNSSGKDKHVITEMGLRNALSYKTESWNYDTNSDDRRKNCDTCGSFFWSTGSALAESLMQRGTGAVVRQHQYCH
jgi:DnaJ-class molecular chaperone